MNVQSVIYHGTGRPRWENVPFGPSGPMVASSTLD